MPLKSLKIRLSVLNIMHPKGEVSSEERQLLAPDRTVLADWARDGDGCSVRVRQELMHFGRATWKSQRSPFTGLCLPWKVQQCLFVPTPPQHLNPIELVK